MRLGALSPSLISPQLLSELYALGIKTDMDFLLGGVHEIMKRLPPQRVSFNEITKTYSSIAEHMSAQGCAASELLGEREQGAATPPLLTMNSTADLDALVDHGKSCVLEVSGDRASGKSVSAFQSYFNEVIRR